MLQISNVPKPRITVGPTLEPVTLKEAKKQCEISTTDTTHDQQLAMLIEQARQLVNNDPEIRKIVKAIRTQSIGEDDTFGTTTGDESGLPDYEGEYEQSEAFEDQNIHNRRGEDELK